MGVTVCFLAVAGIARAASNESVAAASVGGWVANSHYQSVSSASQQQPIGKTSSSKHLNYSGFMYAFVMSPSNDADHDGLLDEYDTDDDDDGLPDDIEIAGSAFDPFTPSDPLKADTDGDACADAEEAMAGTDPLDRESVFRILAMTWTNGAASISCTAREGVRYVMTTASNSTQLASVCSAVTTSLAVNGIGVWKSTQVSFTNSTIDDIGFFRIRSIGGE